MRPRRKNVLPIWPCLVGAPVFWLVLLLASPVAQADSWSRPGGGSSYSGGSRSYSGGSRSYSGGGGSNYSGGSGAIGCDDSGGSGGDFGWLIGLLIVVVFVLVITFVLKATGEGNGWSSGGSSEWGDGDSSGGGSAWDDAGNAWAGTRGPVDLSGLRAHDPHFSQIVLEDFLSNLYVRAQESRGVSQSNLELLAPYLSLAARASLSNRGGRPVEDVTGVIVGAQKIEKLYDAEAEAVSIIVHFETNYTELYEAQGGTAPGAPMSYYVQERWTLSRKRTAQSRPPDKVHSFHCPSCGAPVEKSQDEACGYCNTTFGSGEFDWFVEKIELLREEPRGPLLTSDVAEQGTDSATLKAPTLGADWKSLQQKDPALDWDAIKARLGLIYDELNTAWSNLTWDDVRPYVTDRFHLAQQYWINAYRAQGLRNILKGARITRTEVVKVTSDPYFDALTIRFWADGLDYTIHEASERVISGSKTNQRTYSEYWTLVRSAATQGPTRADKNCPNCGAPLDIGQTGQCTHCDAKITGGAFDWVLSRIEQDESYAG